MQRRMNVVDSQITTVDKLAYILPGEYILDFEMQMFKLTVSITGNDNTSFRIDDECVVLSYNKNQSFSYLEQFMLVDDPESECTGFTNSGYGSFLMLLVDAMNIGLDVTHCYLTDASYIKETGWALSQILFATRGYSYYMKYGYLVKGENICDSLEKTNKRLQQINLKLDDVLNVQEIKNNLDLRYDDNWDFSQVLLVNSYIELNNDKTLRQVLIDLYSKRNNAQNDKKWISILNIIAINVSLKIPRDMVKYYRKIGSKRRIKVEIDENISVKAFYIRTHENVC